MSAELRLPRQKLTRVMAQDLGATLAELRELMRKAGHQVGPNSRFDWGEIGRAITLETRKIEKHTGQIERETRRLNRRVHRLREKHPELKDPITQAAGEARNE